MCRIIINTYNRPEELSRLLEQLKGQAEVSVFNDGSKKKYDIPDWVDYHHSKLNHGKRKYWQLVNMSLELVRQSRESMFIYMPDDVTVDDKFVQEATRMLRAIRDPKKICLNLLLDKGREGKPCWTGFIPKELKVGKYRYYHTQWVDMCFIANRNFFEALNYKLDPIPRNRWKYNKDLGSGVGHQISIRLNKAGFNMYQVRPTLVHHGDHKSVMNAHARKSQKIIT